MIDIADYIQEWPHTCFAEKQVLPWAMLQDIEDILISILHKLDDGYDVKGNIAVHRTAIIENGAIVKGPAVIGPGCFVAATAYLRGGVYLGAGSIAGPGVEMKTVVMMSQSKLAHFNFAGDSLIGSSVNIEAGAILANYRNEMADKTIRIRMGETILDTGCMKFGALIGDGVRIGANAVIAPGAILKQNSQIKRLALIDQYPCDPAYEAIARQRGIGDVES